MLGIGCVTHFEAMKFQSFPFSIEFAAIFAAIFVQLCAVRIEISSDIKKSYLQDLISFL